MVCWEGELVSVAIPYSPRPPDDLLGLQKEKIAEIPGKSGDQEVFKHLCLRLDFPRSAGTLPLSCPAIVLPSLSCCCPRCKYHAARVGFSYESPSASRRLARAAPASCVLYDIGANDCHGVNLLTFLFIRHFTKTPLVRSSYPSCWPSSKSSHSQSASLIGHQSGLAPRHRFPGSYFPVRIARSERARDALHLLQPPWAFCQSHGRCQFLSNPSNFLCPCLSESAAGCCPSG